MAILYRDLENKLFEEWEIRSKANWDNTPLAPDGLLYRGEVVYNANGCWIHCPGDETERWQHAPKRLLILTKDLNEPDDSWDIRAETGRKNGSGQNHIVIPYLFYKQLMRWAYGLLAFDSKGKTPSFAMANNPKVYGPFYDEAPIARINCKKQAGGGAISNSLLKTYMERYSDLLLRQINLYDADILLCCGGQGIITNYILKHYLPDTRKINTWIYYSESARKVVIDSYHPSFWGYSIEGIYNDLTAAYEEFLTQYPQFIGPNR